MDYKTAAKEIGKGLFKPVYILYGPEKYLIQEFTSYLTDHLVEAPYRDFAVSKFDLSESSLEAVIEDAETFPFMVPQKIVIAKDAYFLTTAKESSKVEHNLDKLLEYIKSPADHTILVFTVTADKLDERKKIVKTLKQEDFLIPFLALSPEELVQWIKKQAVKAQFIFATGAAEHLILYSGTNLQNLSTEIDKLSLYVGSNGTANKDHIEQLVVRSVEQNVFILIDEIVHLRMEKIFMIYYELLKQKEDPIKILLLMARQFRIIMQIKELNRQGCAQAQMASQLGLHPYAVKVAAEQGSKYDQKKLGMILSRLAELDYQMKSGRIEKVLGLELFFLKLVG